MLTSCTMCSTASASGGVVAGGVMATGVGGDTHGVVAVSGGCMVLQVGREGATSRGGVAISEGVGETLGDEASSAHTWSRQPWTRVGSRNGCTHLEMLRDGIRCVGVV